MSNSIVIDYLPASAERYREDYAIVVVDVIRATTTATTALSLGREIYPVQTTDDAFVLAKSLPDPILVGELGGNVPYGFQLTNSPVQVSALTHVPSGNFTNDCRPIVFVSSSGTRLLLAAAGAPAVYIACARNYEAVANYCHDRHENLAILGAGTRGAFRREDQIGCAWIAEILVNKGYKPETELTETLISRWHGASPERFREGRSAEYLRGSGQMHDLEFIVHHINDLDIVPELIDGKLTIVSGKHPETCDKHQFKICYFRQ